MINPSFHYLLCGLLGASLTLSFAPFGHWYLALIPLIAVSALLYQTSLTPWKLGFSFGLGWFGAGISWVHVSIANFGGLPLFASIGLMLLLCSYLAAFPALAFHCSQRLQTPRYYACGLAAVWWLTEWLRSWLFTGFPWLSLGYSQTQGPLAAWAPLLGETGLSSLLVFWSALMGQYLCHRRLPAAATALALGFAITIALAQIQWTQATDTRHTIALVQGNIEQDLRWVPAQDQPIMNRYLELTQPHWDKDIVIWPEAAIPRLEPMAQDFLADLDQQALATHTAVITGIIDYNFETQAAFNNLISVGMREGSPAAAAAPYYYRHPNRYGKHQLLPIGEFIPLESWLRGLAPIFDLPMSSFSRGPWQQPNLRSKGVQLVPAICFEIAFSRQLRANLQPDSNFIVTVSNDAWFGDSHGPHQHLEIAQMRAKELGLAVLRATNNGVTAVINADGSLHSSAPQFTETVLTATLPQSSGITPYRYYGDLPGWCLTTLILLLIARHRYLEKRK